MMVGQVIPVWIDDLLHRDRHIDIGRAPPHGAAKTRRCNTGDCELHAIDQNWATGHRRFGLMGSPVVEVENGYWICTRGGFVTCVDKTADRWTHSEHIEVVSADEFGLHRLGTVLPCGTCVMGRRCNQTAEHAVLI